MKKEEEKNVHPPGYRFYPTEEELVSFYLQNKLDNKKTCEIKRVIPVVDIYNYDPWQLPDIAGEIAKEVSTKDAEQWFFFSPIQERESHGGRTNRTAPSGFWKATGTPSSVFSSQNRVIGEKKTLVFYKGKAPRGTKTQWKMNQYKAIDNRPSENLAPETSSSDTGPKLRHEFSLCRVYVKSGCLRSFDRRPLVGESSDTSKRLDLQKRKEVSNSDAPMKEFEEKKLKMDRVCSSEDSNPSMTPSNDAMDLGPIEDLETLWGFTNWV